MPCVPLPFWCQVPCPLLLLRLGEGQTDRVLTYLGFANRKGGRQV